MMQKVYRFQFLFFQFGICIFIKIDLKHYILLLNIKQNYGLGVFYIAVVNNKNLKLLLFFFYLDKF